MGSAMRHLISALVLFIALDPARANASMGCPTPRPACDEFGRAAAVFAGTVARFQGGGVIFAVTESFRGVTTDEVVLRFEGVSGGPNFEVGRSYFVYASASPTGDHLVAPGCGRSGPLEQANEDVEYGRLLMAGGTSGEIFGTVWQTVRDERATGNLPRGGRRVWSGVPVMLRSGTGEVLTSLTGPDGRYSFASPPAGAYTIDVMAPDSAYNPYRKLPLDLTDARACRTWDIELRSNGRITGRVVTAGGAPVGGIAVTLDPDYFYFDGRTIRTDDDGHFEVNQLLARRYRVGVRIPGATPGSDQPHFDPRAPEVTLGDGERQSIPDVILPAEVNVVELEGVVVGDDGTPLDRAPVFVREENGSLRESLKTDADGTFRTIVVPGQRYRVSAGDESRSWHRLLSAASATVDIISAKTVVRLIVGALSPK